MLTTDFLPNIGGIAAHVVGLSEGLSQLGHSVTVVVPQPARLKLTPRVCEEYVQNFRVIRLGVPTLPRLGWLLYQRKAAAWLQQTIRSGYDIVHWHTFDQAMIRRLRDVTRVFTNHTSQFLEYVANPVEMSRARKIVQPADWVIAPSRELAEATLTTGYPADRVCVIPNGVNIDIFSPNVDGQGIRHRHRIAPDECVVLCPRRLEKKNGVIYWVRAIPGLLSTHCERIRFLLVGDYQRNDQYSAREEVLSAIARLDLGDQFIFTGAVPNSEMPAYFAAADIVVIPSLMEATSIAGLEAMASGKPIVSTNVGGLPEIVLDGKTGYLVPPADSPALAGAMRKLIAAPSLRESMGQAARERVLREFDWRVIAERTAAVYRQARMLP